MRMVVVKNEKVVGVIEAEPGFDYGDGSVCIPSDTATLHDSYIGGEFIPLVDDGSGESVVGVG